MLQKVAQRVREITPEIEELAQNMLETMYAYHGIGLAANQVGLPLRLFVWDIGEKPGVVLNPRILRVWGEEVDTEGCLSLPGVYASIRRAQGVLLRGTDLRGRTREWEAEGLLARVFQHELDHLEGILILERALPGSLRIPEDSLVRI